MWASTREARSGPVIGLVEIIVPVPGDGRQLIVARLTERISFTIGRRISVPMIVRTVDVEKVRSPVIRVQVAREQDTPRKMSEQLAAALVKEIEAVIEAELEGGKLGIG